MMARENWWTRHVEAVKAGLRVVFGLVWLVAGALKFTSGFVDGFPGAVQAASDNSPSWLSGWYAFWVPQASANPALIVYTVGFLELALGLALLFGFMRKVAYVGGVALSLLIWAVPEGFGGPYGAGAGGTDVGTGVIYALVFVGLIVINATFGASRWSLDAVIERRWSGWSRIAEFGAGDSMDERPQRVGVGVGL
jgi:uncharacterized membrane protein YphA (DoxX/SURF4 family)